MLLTTTELKRSLHLSYLSVSPKAHNTHELVAREMQRFEEAVLSLDLLRFLEITRAAFDI